jgi:hypothetical protein
MSNNQGSKIIYKDFLWMGTVYDQDLCDEVFEKGNYNYSLCTNVWKGDDCTIIEPNIHDKNNLSVVSGIYSWIKFLS